jgi:hypothetical protein
MTRHGKWAQTEVVPSGRSGPRVHTGSEAGAAYQSSRWGGAGPAGAAATVAARGCGSSVPVDEQELHA